MDNENQNTNIGGVPQTPVMPTPPSQGVFDVAPVTTGQPIFQRPTMQVPTAAVTPQPSVAPVAPSDTPLTTTISANAQGLSRAETKKGRSGIRRIITLIGVGAMLIVAVVILFNSIVNRPSQKTSNNIAGVYSSQTLPLGSLDLGTQNLLSGAASMTINGSLKVTSGFVLNPTNRPTSATAGQLYYDKSNNQLAYYNGAQFVALTGSGPVVQSIGGLNGQVTLGGGLGIVGNQLTAVNNGVLSFAGQNGNIAVGGGLSMNGTTLQNTGVLSLASVSPNIELTNDGSGNVSINLVGAGTGTVGSAGGSVGRIPVFTGAQTIGNSLIEQSGNTVTITGDLNIVTGGLSLGNPLTVSNGGTGTISLAANGVLVGNGTAAVGSVTADSAGLCLISTLGAPSWSACTGSGGVTALNGLSGALSVANASAAGTTVTIDNASTTNKGIASFNSTNFSVNTGVVTTIQDINTSAAVSFGRLNLASSQATSPMIFVNNTNAGASGYLLDLQHSGTSQFTVSPAGVVTTTGTINGQTISATASFSGTLGVSSNTTVGGTLAVNGGTINSTGALGITPSGTLTLGSPNQTLALQGGSGSNFVVTSGANSTTLNFQAPGATVTYRLATASAGSYDICTTAGNCTGLGGTVSTSGGTNNKLAKFNGAQSIADSSITDNGATVTTTGNLVVQGGQMTVGVANSQSGSLTVAYGAANFAGVIQPGTLTGNQTYTLPNASGTICLDSGNCLGGSGGGANVHLSNLTSVAINTSLLPGSATIDLGSSSAPFRELYLAGTSATPGTNNFKITGVSTGGTRTITLPNASGTVCLQNSTDCGFAIVAGSTAYIQNTSTLQTNANFNIQSADVAKITGVLRATTGQTADIFQVQNSSGVALFRIDSDTNTTAVIDNLEVDGQDYSASAVTIKTSTNGGGRLALDIQRNDGTSVARMTNDAQLYLGNDSGITGLLGLEDSGHYGSFTGSGTLSSDRSYYLPNATGTLCLDSNNCNYVTPQTASAGTIPVFTSSTAVGNSLLSQAGSTVTVNGNLSLASGSQYQINGTQISSANLSNDSNLAKLSASQTFTGNTVAFQNVANSTNAFAVQNATGNAVLSIDTVNGQVVIGKSSLVDGKLVFKNDTNNYSVTIEHSALTADRLITLPNAGGVLCTDSGNCAGVGATLQTGYNFSAGGTTPKIKVNDTLLGVDIQDADTTIGADLFDVRASNAGLGGLGSVMFGIGSTGSITLQNSVNSTAAMQILTQGGTKVMVADTTNGQVILGQSTTLNGKLVLNNATNSYNVTLSAPNTTGSSKAITLPNESGVLCVQNSTNCGFAITTGSTAYIQNGTSLQTSANFNIDGTGSAAILQAATFDTGSGVALNIGTTNATSINLNKNTSVAANQTFTVQGTALFKSATNATNALTIQNAGATQTLFNADTINGRVGVGGVASYSKFEVLGGDAAIYNNGNNPRLVLGDSTSAGENGYLVWDSANNYFRIESVGTNGMKINDNYVTIGNIFPDQPLKIANGTTLLFQVDTTGKVLAKNSTDSTTALQVQNAAGTTTVLNVDTTNTRVGIGTAAPTAALDVVGGIQQRGFTTTATASTANLWTQLGSCTITAQYQNCLTTVNIIGGGNGTPTGNSLATVSARVKQQAVMGSAPIIQLTMNDTAEIITKNDIVTVTTQNDGTATVVQLWGRITLQYENWYYTPVMDSGWLATNTIAPWQWTPYSSLNASLPAGTQTAAIYSDQNANTLTVQAAGGNAAAFQVQNAAGSKQFAINTTIDSATAPSVSMSAAAGSNQGGTLSGSSSATYYYRVTAITAAGEVAASPETSINGSSFTTIAAPASALTTGSPSVAGNVSCNGTTGCTYVVTFVTANGETSGSPVSTARKSVSLKQIPLNNIPTGAAGTTARNIYRSTNGGTYKLCLTINNNTATSTNDNTADMDCTLPGYPSLNTATTNTNNATITFSAVTGATSYKVYRGTSPDAETAYQTTASSPFTDTGAAGTAGTVPTGFQVMTNAYFQNATDSTTALQVNNAAGTQIMTVDTTNKRVVLGNAGGNTVGQLFVGGSASGNALGSVTIPGSMYLTKVIVQGKYAYATGWNDTSGQATLFIYDITNPASPTLVSSNDLYGDYPQDMAVQGKYVYIAASTGCFIVWDISNPYDARQIMDNNISGIYYYNITVSGRYAYLGGYDNSGNGLLYMWDIGESGGPVMAGEYPLSAAGLEVVGLTTQGSLLYVNESASWNNGYATNKLQIYDISTPLTPILLGSVNIPRSSWPMAISGHYLYTTSDVDNVIQVIDVLNTAAPAIVKTINVGTGSSPEQMSIQGNYLYVALKGLSKIAIYDISTPASPSAVGAISAGTDSINTLYVQGRYAYTASDASVLQTYDLGGAYIQQLEAGGTQTGTLRVDGNTSLGGNASIQGSVGVGGSMNIGGDFSAGGVLRVNSTGYGFYDGFEATTLDTNNWTWTPNGGSYSLTNVPGDFQISLPSGSHDCWTGGVSCAMLLHPASNEDPAQSSVYEFGLDGNLPVSGTYAGIMFYEANNYFMRFEFQNTGSGIKAQVGINNNGTGTVPLISGVITLGGYNEIKITRVHYTYTFEYYTSSSGTWTTLGTFTSSAVYPYQIGLYAGNYGSTAATFNMDFFELYPLNMVTLENSDAPVHLCVNMTYCNATVGVTGNIAATGTVGTNANPDVSETIAAAPDVSAGDVVMADPNNTERVVKSGGAYSSAVVGVISDGSSGFVIDHPHFGQEGKDDSAKPLVIAGRVPVKVTSEGGAIKPGDYLTASSTPGVAMKATKAGPSIGKALGFFDSDSGTVLALINLSYYTPSTADATTGQVNDLQGQLAQLGAQINSGDLQIASLTVTGDAKIGGNLTVAGTATVGTLVVTGHIISGGDTPTIKALDAAGQGATVKVEGTDTAGTITITPGTGVAADDLAKIMFSKPYEAVPNVSLTPMGRAGANAQPYVDNPDKSSFQLGTGMALQAGTTYMFTYHTLQ